MLFEGVDYPYEIVSRERHKIGRIEVIKDTICIDGQCFPYTFTRQRDSVCVFPVCDEGIVILEQYRHAINRWMLEIPAGGIDAGEREEDAARRELQEETGFVVDELIDMGEYFVNEGVSSSRCTLFFARCHRAKAPSPEKTELIRTRVVSREEFDALVREGKFALLIGLAAYYRSRENNWLR